MTDTPKPRSREAQKEDLALRMTIGFPSTEATLNNAEAHIAEAEARERMFHSGNPTITFMANGKINIANFHFPNQEYIQEVISLCRQIKARHERATISDTPKISQLPDENPRDVALSELVPPGGEPIRQIYIRHEGWSDLSAGKTFEEDYQGSDVLERRTLYAHPDPLLAAKDAEIIALRAELDRLRKPKWFADADDPDHIGDDEWEVMEAGDLVPFEVLAIDCLNIVGKQWVFRVDYESGEVHRFATKEEAEAAVAAYGEHDV